MEHFSRSRPVRAALAAGIALAATLAPLHPASGQETREHDFPALETEPGPMDHVEIRFKAANRFVGAADFGAFDASQNQPEARVTVTFPVSERAGLRLMNTGRMLIFDFGGDAPALFGAGPQGGEPFGLLYSWSTRLQGAVLLPETWKLFTDEDQWAVLAEARITSSWEDGSDMGDGVEGGGSLAAGYKLGKKLEVAAGISVGSQVLGGVGVSPLVEFDWKITDEWALRSYGRGLQIERKLGDDLRVFARARLEGSKYRLDRRAAPVNQGLMRVEQLPVGLGVRWNATPWLRIGVIAGAMVRTELRVLDQNERTIAKETAGPAPYVTVRIDAPH